MIVSLVHENISNLQLQCKLVTWSWSKFTFVECEFKLPDSFHCECRCEWCFISNASCILPYIWWEPKACCFRQSASVDNWEPTKSLTCFSLLYIWNQSFSEEFSTNLHSIKRCLKHSTNFKSDENVWSSCIRRKTNHWMTLNGVMAVQFALFRGIW